MNGRATRKPYECIFIIYDGDNYEEVLKWISVHCPRPAYLSEGKVIHFPHDHSEAAPGMILVKDWLSVEAMSPGDFRVRYEVIHELQTGSEGDTNGDASAAE